MGCSSCGGGVQMSMDSFTAPPQMTAYGVYPLQAYPDCTTAYTGPYRASSVYVVGYGTEYESVFARTSRNEAIEYQTTADPNGRLSLFSAPATKMCDQAMVDLFGK